MVRLIDANALIRYIELGAHPEARYTRQSFISWINKQPHILIDKVNTLDEVKQRGVFVARKEK